MLEQSAVEQLLEPKATKLLIFRKHNHGQPARKQNETREAGIWLWINGRCWGPLDPYDKVMKERRIAGVEPG